VAIDVCIICTLYPSLSGDIVECTIQVFVARLSKECDQFGVHLRRFQILRDANNTTVQTFVSIGAKILIVMRYHEATKFLCHFIHLRICETTHLKIIGYVFYVIQPVQLWEAGSGSKILIKKQFRLGWVAHMSGASLALQARLTLLQRFSVVPSDNLAESP